MGGARFVLSRRPVLELVDDWVIFDGAKLSCVLATELPELTASLSLPSGTPFGAPVGRISAPGLWTCGGRATSAPAGPERRKSARSAVALLFVTVASRACNFEGVLLGRAASGFGGPLMEPLGVVTGLDFVIFFGGGFGEVELLGRDCFVEFETNDLRIKLGADSGPVDRMKSAKSRRESSRFIGSRGLALPGVRTTPGDLGSSLGWLLGVSKDGGRWVIAVGLVLLVGLERKPLRPLSLAKRPAEEGRSWPEPTVSERACVCHLGESGV
jgi:hypothetical protein